MSEPNWDLLLGSNQALSDEQRALVNLLKDDPEALSSFKDHVLVDAMLAEVYGATRFDCLEIDTLGGIASGAYRADNSELIHLGGCRRCREELQELEQFHMGLETEEETASSWSQRLRDLGRSFVDQLHIPQSAPLYAATDVGNSSLPAITCGILSQPMTFHVAAGELKLEPTAPLVKPLLVKVTAEQGESIVSCEGAGPFRIPLDRVWEIHIGE